MYLNNHSRVKDCRGLENYSYEKCICTDIITENVREFITSKTFAKILNSLPTAKSVSSMVMSSQKNSQKI